MNKYDQKAEHLQHLNVESEGRREYVPSSKDVRQSIVATREDITMVVSYLSSLNKQIAQVRWLLAALTVVVILVAIFK